VQYRLAIKTNPNDVVTCYNLGVLLSDLGKNDEAKEQYRLAINVDPNYAEAHNNLANLLRKEGRFAEAEEEVRTALNIDPLNPNYLGTLGDILADEGWLDESEKEYKFALYHSDKMNDSAKSDIHNNLGWVYSKKKLYYNAKDEFFKARTIDPRNIKAIRNLRAVERIETPSEITREQIVISGFLFLLLSSSFYLFLIAKLNETSFSALFMFFTATILFVLLYKSMGRFSVGPKGVEFEMSFEHKLALAQAQTAESISKIER
jgi:tetratricopeptide (TPR) repeat protein